MLRKDFDEKKNKKIQEREKWDQTQNTQKTDDLKQKGGEESLARGHRLKREETTLAGAKEKD